MLARDYCKDPIKPVIISHHMLMGMKEGQEKMSKSVADSAIFMEDSVKDVERKIKKAYCPEQVVEKNPRSNDGQTPFDLASDGDKKMMYEAIISRNIFLEFESKKTINEEKS